MDLLTIVRDGGTGMLVLLLPAIAGTVLLSTVRLLLGHGRCGTTDASILVVVGSAGTVVAHGMSLAVDVIASRGVAPEMLLALLRISGETALLAAGGVGLLSIVAWFAAIRNGDRTSAERERRSVRSTLATGRIVAAFVVLALLVALTRIAGWADPEIFESVVAPNPAREVAIVSAWIHAARIGGWLGLAAGVLGLALILRPRSGAEPAVVESDDTEL